MPFWMTWPPWHFVISKIFQMWPMMASLVWLQTQQKDLCLAFISFHMQPLVFAMPPHIILLCFAAQPLWCCLWESTIWTACQCKFVMQVWRWWQSQSLHPWKFATILYQPTEIKLNVKEMGFSIRVSIENAAAVWRLPTCDDNTADTSWLLLGRKQESEW